MTATLSMGHFAGLSGIVAPPCRAGRRGRFLAYFFSSGPFNIQRWPKGSRRLA
jgi:hypothetical protein